MSRLIFPHPTLASTLSLSMSRVLIDAMPSPGVRLDPKAHLDLSGVEGSWNLVTFEVICESDAADIARFERDHGPVSVIIAVNCRPTNTRLSFRPTRMVDHWTGSVRLPRRQFSNRADVRAVASASLGEPGLIVGSSNRLVVHFDAKESLQIGGSLPSRWVNFEQAEAPVLAKSNRKAPYVVDLSQSPPELLLNSAFPNLQTILAERKGRSHLEQALHDTVRVGIARSVWLALFQDALASVKRGEAGEEPDWPEAEWQRELLETVLGDIFPDATELQLLERAAETWSSSAGTGELMSRAEAAIGRCIGAEKILDKSMRRLDLA